MIIHASTAMEVLNAVSNLKEHSVVFCDVDDTLITPKSKTFRAPPYSQLIDWLKTLKDTAHVDYIDIISAWREQRRVILLDQNWPKIIKDIEKICPIYGLTKMDSGPFGRISSLEHWRYKELEGLGITFSPSPNITDIPSLYQGILMTGPYKKSEAITRYKEFVLTKNTKTIVMIDDRMESLDDISEFCDNKGFHFLGILFNGLQNFSDTVDPICANFQKNYLLIHKIWLEDDEVLDKIDRMAKNPKL